jgi:hypothetical protein
MDSRFVFEDPPGWRGGTRQLLQGSEYEVVKPTKPVEEQPKQVEFEMMSNNPILFGNGSRFQIQGTFERKAAPAAAVAGQAAAAAPEWEAVPVEDRANIILAPNWFELMIQSVDIYHGNGVIRTHDEANFIPSMLNTYLYSRMDPTVKKFLCTEDLAPGYGVPSSSKPWEFTSDEWKTYAEKVFTGETITFSWIPLHTFPFFQSPNFLMDPVPLKALPALRNLGKVTCRITFRDDLDCIWRKRVGANNTRSYRFKFLGMTLGLEEARINPSLERQLFSPVGKNKVLNYPGVTKIMKAETINNQVFFHNCKFDSVPFPEGIFIFAVPKKVIASTYKYSDHTANDPVFMKHNIQSLTVDYDGEPLNLKQPHFGDISDRQIQLKYYLDHIVYPPFGLDIDQSKLKRSDFANSFGDTNFPSVYLNLCTDGGKQRLIPHQNSGSVLAKDCDLNIGIKFGGTGATNNATYIVYLFYTDFSCVLDLRTRRFTPYYNLK